MIKNCKNEGITLISLIITIIILLILAGVSISLIGNKESLFTKLEVAKNLSRAEQIKEKIILWELENALNSVNNKALKSINTLLDEMKNNGLVSETEYNMAVLYGYIIIGDEIILFINEEKTRWVNNEEELTLALQETNIDTIIIMSSFNITKEIVVNRNLKIAGNDNSVILNRGADYLGKFINVKSGYDLVLSDLVLDGGAKNWSFSQEYADANATSNPTSETATALVLSDSDIKASDVLISNSGNLILDNCILQNNINMNSQSAALSTKGTTSNIVNVKLNNTIIKHCASYKSNGAAIASNYSNIEINNINIVDNYGYDNGAILYIYNSNITMNSGRLNDNNYYGNGAVMVYVNSKFILNNGEIINNMGYKKSGGSHGSTIYVHNKSTFIMNDGNVENNSTINGCIFAKASDAKVYLNKGRIANNISLSNSKFQNLFSGICTVFNIEKDVTIVGNAVFYNKVINRGTINGNVYSYENSENCILRNEGIINGAIYAGTECVVENIGTVTEGIIYEE